MAATYENRPEVSNWFVTSRRQLAIGSDTFVLARMQYGQPGTPLLPLMKKLSPSKLEVVMRGCGVGALTIRNMPSAANVFVFHPRLRAGIAGVILVNAPK